ncbi:hypothetical protein BCU30_008005 [Vibrio lentus]|uniref:hypothetical protein n=1 Tax=Vibrio lentus TaxID=136468 RepID=UPI000C824FE8|nr:hypothetical protein [Vibrio lentus]PMH63275.1 hypothetical protein BCU64_09805 [Vibrio lentus]PMJ14390.1 hypothetical protein BCU30_00750 [Vibrio lentus]PMJ87354.1 hypothetical protein BCU13_11095 [Vibrio lentus]
MKKMIAVLITLLLSGCSLFITGAYLGKDWPGRDVDALIEHWGEPNEVIVSDGGEKEVIYKIFSDTCTYTFYADSADVITDYDYESTWLGTCKPIG